MADIEKVIKEAEEALEFLAPDEKHRLHMGIMMKLGWIYDALDLLKSQPQIVRCNECKWFIKKFENEGRCIKHDNDYHDPDWFCADGERKSD